MKHKETTKTVATAEQISLWWWRRLATVLTGARNGRQADMLAREVRKMRAAGLSYDDSLRLASRASLVCCTPPIPNMVVEKLVDKAYAGNEIEAPPLTDLGNAERLVARHRLDLLYCDPWRAWFVWDGQRWTRDVTRRIYKLTAETVRQIYAEAGATVDDKQRKAVAAWALKSEQEPRIEAMISLARTEFAIAPEAFDADDWLLNVQNGTIDLRSGALRDHRREDFITKLAPVEFDPAADAPLWRRFLEQVQPDPTMRDYHQRLAGYWATGDNRDQAIYCLFGSGSNGKSTYLRRISTALGGDYARPAPDNLLVTTQFERHPVDMADLAGARLITAIETEDGQRLAEARVKKLTGEDESRVRRMRENFWTLRHTMKLVLATNHKPRVRGTDNAIWRRIRLIPWTTRITHGERDEALGERLDAELPGILNWIVAGCLSWQRDGFRIPKAVSQATSEYKRSEDAVAAFIAERCTEDLEAKVAIGALYRVYAAWCKESNERPLTKNQLSDELVTRGCERTTVGSKKNRGLRGIRLATSDDAEDGIDAV